MKREKISEALGNIGSRHIEEAVAFRAKEEARHPQNAWIKWASLAAACFALAILAVPIINHFNAPLQNVMDNTWDQTGPIEDPPVNIQGNTPEKDTSQNDDTGNNKPEGSIPSENDSGNNPENSGSEPNTPGDPSDDPGQNDPGSLPSISVEYGSIEEAHNAIKYNTLCSNIVLDESGFSSINTIFPSSSGTEGLLINPQELLIHTSYDRGGFTDMVDYYVLFNKESVDESYVDGYVEQGLTKEINGVTVHYCLFESDGGMQGQAKFLYDGNLYVIDVKSSGTECTLDTYIDMVLK